MSRWAVLVAGVVITLGAAIYGLAAEQVAHIWAAVIVEAAGIGVLIPGLHLVIEGDAR